MPKIKIFIKKIASKDEMKITNIAEVHISINILISTFVVDKVWKIKQGEPMWVSKKPIVFSWSSILNLETKKPKRIRKKTGPLISKICWYIFIMCA